ncbi:unnamed protein product [Closterium sp. Naga37s-1]|nr:unnamed protein product [Closterium sp. Naga37s-1]
MGNQTSVVDALVDLEFPSAAAPPAARLPPGHDLPMGVLSFEVASLMRKALDLWRQLDARNIAGLEKQLQAEGLKRLGVGDYSLRWRLAGAEYASDLTALTAAVGVLARRCGGARSGEVLKRLRGYSRAWKREDSFSEGEADELMRFLREKLEPMGALHNAMLALDDVINSSVGDPEVQNPKTRRPKGKPQAAVMEQMQVVHQLQRASLWNHPLERPVLMLAVSIGVLWQQYRSVFGRPAPPKQEELKATLGAAGLPSVYARVLLGVEQMREMSPISPPFKEQRRELYSILPSTVRRRLAKRLKQRSKRQIDGAIAKDLKAWWGISCGGLSLWLSARRCGMATSRLAHRGGTAGTEPCWWRRFITATRTSNPVPAPTVPDLPVPPVPDLLLGHPLPDLPAPLVPDLLLEQPLPDLHLWLGRLPVPPLPPLDPHPNLLLLVQPCLDRQTKQGLARDQLRDLEGPEAIQPDLAPGLVLAPDLGLPQARQCLGGEAWDPELGCGQGPRDLRLGPDLHTALEVRRRGQCRGQGRWVQEEVWEEAGEVGEEEVEGQSTGQILHLRCWMILMVCRSDGQQGMSVQGNARRCSRGSG